jgi:hypothetical protein
MRQSAIPPEQQRCPVTVGLQKQQRQEEEEEEEEEEGSDAHGL